MIKKSAVILGMIFLIAVVGFVMFASAQGVSYCCEKTLDTDPSEEISNAVWCMDAPEESCDTSYRVQQGSCQSTDYCIRGTCVNIVEGTCTEQVPETLCKNPPEGASGAWYEEDAIELEQCQMGCCFMGDQVAFGTRTRCTYLETIYGETIFRDDIANSLECFANSGRSTKGACVLETDTGRTCEFGTKGECLDRGGNFREGLLCTNDDLGTDCAPTEKTTCIEGKDEVFFVDTCGNPANIYDASRTAGEDPAYWQEIMLPNCANADGTIDAEKCGDCGYSSSGTTCVEYKRSIDRGMPGLKGDYVCRSLDCEDTEFKERFGRNPQHGESWCLGDSNYGLDESLGLEFSSLEKIENLPGSRDVKMKCLNGEVISEPCYDNRGEICLEGSENDIRAGECFINRWEDCYFQDNENDCEDSSLRDCAWVSGRSIMADEEGRELAEEDGVLVSGEGSGATCVPKYSPGFSFWESGGGSTQCGLASRQCVVTYKKRFTEASIKVDGEITCLDDDGELVTSWTSEMNNLCTAMGDCGISVNYNEQEGDDDINDLFTVIGEPFVEEEEE